MLENTFTNPTRSLRRAPADELYYLAPRHPSINDTIFIESIGITRPNPDYRMERSRSGVNRIGIYVFEYVISGHGYIECDGIKYSVGPGDFYFLNSSSSHVYYTDADDPYCKVWINARGKLIDKLLEAYGITDQAVVISLDAQSIFSDLKDIFTDRNDEDLNQRNYKATLKITELIMMMERELRHADHNVDLPLKLKLYIDNHMDFALTVEQLSEKFHLNSNYVTSVFKRKYGISPKQYMLERKIQCAKRMLASPQCEIKEISVALAFSSVYHFSNTFKRITGITPSEYRRSTSHTE